MALAAMRALSRDACLLQDLSTVEAAGGDSHVRIGLGGRFLRGSGRRGGCRADTQQQPKRGLPGGQGAHGAAALSRPTLPQSLFACSRAGTHVYALGLDIRG